MSLNKIVDYDKYTILNGQLKADKLGLKNATDDYPVCVSNTGNKELISRKLTPNDINVNLYGIPKYFYKQRTTKINIVNTAEEVSSIYQNSISSPAVFDGDSSIDCSAMQKGDFIEFKGSGFHSTRNGQNELLKGLYVSINDGSISEVFQVYFIPPAAPVWRQLFSFPKAPLNDSIAQWNINIKLVKFENDNIAGNVRLEVQFNSLGEDLSTQENKTFGNIFKLTGTQALNWSNVCSFSFAWKYGSAPYLAPQFQIYTETATMSQTTQLRLTHE